MVKRFVTVRMHPIAVILFEYRSNTVRLIRSSSTTQKGYTRADSSHGLSLLIP